MNTIQNTLNFPILPREAFQDEKAERWSQLIHILNDKIKENIVRQYQLVEHERWKEDVEQYMSELYYSNTNELDYDSDFDVYANMDSQDM